MQQLSGIDNMFLFGESANVYNHVAMLMIYDPSTAPGGKVRVRDILKHFEERIYLHPVFRRRLVNSPLNIDRPYWIADGDIDVEFHIRHISLPQPGDWRQLMIQVARLHSRPLDRNFPLWEAYIIEGLDNIPKLPPGSFAMFMKLHHSAVDGMAGVLLAEQMHSLSPNPDAFTARQKVLVDSPPSPLEFVSRAVSNGVGRAASLASLGAHTLKKAATLGIEQVKAATGTGAAADAQTSYADLMAKAPPTRFTKSVSAHRVVEGFGIPLSRIKRVREAFPGSSLNDIFLAISGGAVRRYLSAKNELPDESLIAMMPISLRSDASAGGNDVGTAMVRVRSDIADPVERLRAVHHEAQKGKANAEMIGPDLLKNLFNALPSIIGQAFVDKVLTQQANLTVSNVRGPDKAMYLAGAKAMCLYPVSIPTNHVGLNITGVSYNRVMWISAVSCREMLPDSGFFLACMKESFDELLALADAAKPPPVAAETRTAAVKAKRVAGISGAKSKAATSRRKSRTAMA